MTSFVLTVSLVLQVAAAGLALRLIRVSGRRAAWLLVASAVALMAVRRGITLVQIMAGDRAAGSLGTELVALCISVLLVLGIASIKPLLASIRQAETEVRQLLEAAPDAMVISDEQDQIVLVNAQATRLFDYPRRDLIGKDTEILIPERYRGRHRSRRARYHDAPRPRVLGTDEEIFGLRRDGTEVPVEISLSPLEAARGRFVVSAIRDVTERRAAEAAVREGEAKYRSLLDDVLDSSAVGVCILDRDRRIVWVNRAFEGYFGLNRREVIGFDVRRIVRERLRFLFVDPVGSGDRLLATYDEGAGIESFECRLSGGNGSDGAWLLHWSQPIESGPYMGGRIEHYSDISERKHAYDRVRLFAQIARNVPMGLLVYRLEDRDDDRSLRLVAVNPEAERLLGATGEKLLGLRIDDAFPDLRKRGVPSLFADVVRTGESREMQDFEYGDDVVEPRVWSFRAFALPDDAVGVAFESVEARRRADEKARRVLAAAAGGPGDEVLPALALGLSGELGLEYAMIGRLDEADPAAVRTLAVVDHGALAENFTYGLEGAPCAEVVGRHVCCHPRDVCEHFPDDQWLREVGAKCYVGAPLFDSAGRAVGLVATVGLAPLADPATAQAVVEAVAARASVELERLRRHPAL